MTSRARPSAGRRNTAIAAVTGVVAGLLFLYPTSFDHSVDSPSAVQASTAPAASAAASGSTGSARAQSIGYSAEDSSSAKAGSSSSSTARTVTGSAIQTRYGPVQVQLTISGSKILSATAVEYPNSNGRDSEINSYAIPQLNSEVVAAQSASIDTVSGATYTSNGYLRSLQAALDSAHLA